MCVGDFEYKYIVFGISIDRKGELDDDEMLMLGAGRKFNGGWVCFEGGKIIGNSFVFRFSFELDSRRSRSFFFILFHFRFFHAAAPAIPDNARRKSFKLVKASAVQKVESCAV